MADNADPTGLATVTRQDLSAQTQVQATLGYASSYTVAAPSGASSQQITQAQETVTLDRQTLSADEQAATDASAADDQSISADQAGVTTDRTTLHADQATQSHDCNGTGASSGASSGACSQDTQTVAQDQTQLTQADQQLAAARLAATRDQHQNQAKITSDQTRLHSDETTLTSLRATELGPGTTYTWLPSAGATISEDQPVYAVSGQPVPLLYGPVAAYRAFYLGMSDGPDVAELTRDLITLGYGHDLTPSDHYTSATAAAVERWQRAVGQSVTGEILLGQVVFEPGALRVTTVTPSVGEPVSGASASGTGSGAAEGGAAGGGSVLSASSTTRQVSIAFDANDQSEVKTGDQVSITLPNGQSTPGVISSVGSVATAGQNGGSPTITVLVRPSDPAATGTWDRAQVNVTITTGSVREALVVPVDALLAQTSGGYAVEVVGNDGVHHLVPVGLGLFDDADGLVQVTGTSLDVGQRIVVPAL